MSTVNKKENQYLNTFVTTWLLHTHTASDQGKLRKPKEKAPNVKEDEKQNKNSSN